MNFLLEHLNEIDIGDVSGMIYDPGSTHIMKTGMIGKDKFFIKFSQDDLVEANNPSLQILVEYAAYKIYSLYPGVSIPETIHLVYDAKNNRVGLATSEVKGKAGLISMSPEKLGKMLSGGVFVDIFLANWDVVGMGDGNIIVAKDTATRIDPGGALTFRAQGGRKGSKFSPEVGELKTMLDPKFGAGSVLQYSDLKAAAKVFMKVSWPSIKQTLDATNKEIMIEFARYNMNELAQEWRQEYGEIVSVLTERHKVVMKHIQFIFKK